MCPTENGVGYSRRIGNQLVWYAEHRALTFGHVFFGTVEEGTGTGPEFTIPRPDGPHTICPPRPGGREDRIVGRLIDVPKGSSCNFGRTMFQTDTDYSDGTCDWVVHKLLRVGRRDLGCSAWHSFPTLRDLLGVSGVPVAPGYQGFGRENLTGRWLGDDGGTYYIRHVTADGTIAWFAEHPTARPFLGSTISSGAGWAHVFSGEIRGSRVSGMWIDVPKGASDRNGRLSLEIAGADHMRILDSPDFMARNLFRVRSLNINIDVSTIDMLVPEDAGGDEPRLRVLFTKADGDTISPTDRAAARTTIVARDSGSEHWGADLGADPSRPRRLFVPSSIGSFTSTVTELKGIPGDQEPWVGVALSLWDEDHTSAEGRHFDFTDWSNMLRANLEREVQRGRVPDIHSLSGRHHFRFSWDDDDDLLGDGGRLWRWSDLLSLAGSAPDPFSFRMRGEGANYLISGQLRVGPLAPSRCLVSPPAPGRSRLFSWWNRRREDNMLTSDPNWSGLIGEWRDGYRLYRTEGVVFSPELPRPEGTVPLISLWHPTRGDNFATTDSAWADGPIPGDRDGYTRYRIEGFIFDPDRLQPTGTVPLVTWWHGDREDHLTTADPAWSDTAPSPKDGYTRLRKEGYIFRE